MSCRDRVPAPVAEQGPEPLAAAQEVAAGIGEDREIVGDRAQVRRPLLQELLESSVDKVD